MIKGASGKAFAEEIQTELVHADPLVSGTLGQQLVEAFGNTELELAAEILQSGRLRDGEAVLQAGGEPRFFRVLEHPKALFHGIRGGNAAGKLRAVKGIAALFLVGDHLHPVGQRHVVVQILLHNKPPPTARRVIPPIPNTAGQPPPPT